MTTMNELRPVPGFEGAYTVDRSGRIFTVPRVVTRSDRVSVRVAARERKPVRMKTGYLQIMLPKHGSRVTLYVHRIVAEAFVPGRADGLVVNHKDGNKGNNRAENLEWVTSGENNAHAYRVLQYPHPMAGVRGAACKYSTAVEGCDPSSGAVVVEFAAMKDAHRAGYKAPAISRCVKSETKTHRGLRWRLANRPTNSSTCGGHPDKTPDCTPPEQRLIPYGQVAAQ
jgi:hypothetical protein